MLGRYDRISSHNSGGKSTANAVVVVTTVGVSGRLDIHLRDLTIVDACGCKVSDTKRRPLRAGHSFIETARIFGFSEGGKKSEIC